MLGCHSFKHFCGALRQQLQLPPNTRLIHLHHASTTKHVTGNHHIKEYNYFEFPKPKGYEFELWSSSPLEKIKKVSLSEALTDHVKPGFALVPLDEDVELKLPKGDLPRYFINELNTTKVYDPKNARSKGRGSKEFHFKLGVSGKHFAHSLYKSYHFLSRKSGRSPVELHIHGEQVKSKKFKAKSFQTPQDFKLEMETQKKVNEKFYQNVYNSLHLWPETILRAMPEGSNISINPVAKDENICWVMDVGGKIKTKLFEKNKKLHEDLYDQGLGVPDKETRRQVKLAVRQMRKDIREENEKRMKEIKRLQKSKVIDSENSGNILDEYEESPPAKVVNEIEPPKMSDIIAPHLKITRLPKSVTLHSLVTRIDFHNLKSPENSTPLKDLKNLINLKILQAGNKGLVHLCYLERLNEDDRHKVLALALSEIRNRVAQIEEVKSQGTIQVEEENLEIMKRATVLFGECENSKQLLSEARRRISEDLGKLKRENATKLQKSLLKMSRLRKKILDELDPEDIKKLVAPEDRWTRILPNASSTYRSEWSWRSRGSSRSFLPNQGQ